MEFAAPCEQGARRIRQGVAYAALEDLTVLDASTMEPVPRRRDDARRSHVPRQHRHEGLFEKSGGDARAFAGGWFHSGDLG
jgi:fatty-acyl-CoA synthase